MKEFTPPKGWINRQVNESAIDAATWPRWMRDATDDERLTREQRQAAARLLRKRADELDPTDNHQLAAEAALLREAIRLFLSGLAPADRGKLCLHDDVTKLCSVLASTPISALAAEVLRAVEEVSRTKTAHQREYYNIEKRHAYWEAMKRQYLAENAYVQAIKEK